VKELRTIDFLCKDRPGHDLRYAIDANKINKELGWKPSVTLSKDWRNQNWYLENQTWLIILLESMQRIMRSNTRIKKTNYRSSLMMQPTVVLR
jgi:dTDP-D-glucose 4,6-dehydratase